MEESNKYYQPSIEEFHVGFEYEWNDEAICGMLRTRPDSKWYSRTLSSLDRIGIIEAELECEVIRVKYLDQQDIESLGFKYQDKSRYKLGNLWLTHYNNICDLYLHNGEDYDLHECYFDGTIKNKSELKRILNQIRK